MKLLLLAVLVIVAVNGNPLYRSCKCKAVSNTVHYPFHSWDVSSCRLCSCNDPAVANCEKACRALVESYALTGCGKTIKGSKVKVNWDAGSCAQGISENEHTCA